MDRPAVRRAWEAVSETYADQRDPGGSDADLLADLLAELPAEPRVLDVGCGDGARTLANLPADAVGVDLARRGLELARRRVPNPLVQGDMTALPVRSSAFDGLTAYYAVFHVPRDQQPTVYREFARVLRPGGRLLMTLPGGPFHTVRRGWMGGEMLFSAPAREETLDALRAAGFEDLQATSADDPFGGGSEFVFATLGE
jgi:ubiquinone/menaquinone biosynthesis C-methylase UbiE